MLETCAACAHMRAYSDDDDAAKPEPMSDQHVVDTVAVIGDGSLSIHPSILDSMRCRKNNQQFTFVNWEGPRVSKGNKLLRLALITFYPMRWPVAICCAHACQNQNFQNFVQFKWRQISFGNSTSGDDAHEPESARTRSRTSDCIFDSYVAVTTSLAKQRVARLQLRGSRSSSATCQCTERTCPTTCKSRTRSTRSSILWPSRASQAMP